MRQGPLAGSMLIQIRISRLRSSRFKSYPTTGNYGVWEKVNLGLRVSICGMDIISLPVFPGWYKKSESLESGAQALMFF